MEIKEELTEMKKRITEIENTFNKEPDYSKWICRSNTSIAIKGKMWLKSFDNLNKSRDSNSKESYIDELHYEKVSISECKKGDVICTCTKPDEYPPRLEDFVIIVSTDNEECLVGIRLVNLDGVESIETLHFNRVQDSTDVFVIRFLREWRKK